MLVKINGASQEVSSGIMLFKLLQDLNADDKGVAVAVNDDIVPRSRWEEFGLNDGDKIDVIGAVQGG